MWFSLSISFLQWPDLVGFGLYSMRKTYPLASINCDSQIHSLTDTSLCKDLLQRKGPSSWSNGCCSLIPLNVVNMIAKVATSGSVLC
ncbi:hypothetical protein L6164_011554 [Bauhinia variegata]|uniref:Uncharacterized protein n=1 Tax=Bauhinia variegata TaxID=167791 RepID=A0ACB9PA48_BAUVA|nr:hypothetical protein L6164_011554 [Bauhinia variegata]